MNHNTPPISRRRFGRLIGAGAALIAAKPVASFGDFVAGAPAVDSLPALADTVRLNANENPYGPSPMALRAMTDAFTIANRYPDEHADALIDTLARINGVARDQILIGNGSGEILKVCAAAFTGPMRAHPGPPIVLAPRSRGGPPPTFTPGRGKLVVADPTFEAILNHALVNSAKVVKVPLTNTFAHDLGKMLAASIEGLIYICNPNNPTASITPKNEIRELLAGASRQTRILVDEAYFHYADSPDYESVIPLIAHHPNLIVARTFSKIYGMAGLRLGYCVAQKETIEHLRAHQTWDSVNIMAIAAAVASLNDPDQVPNGRRMNSETRTLVLSELESMKYRSIPSQANFIMVDLRRPVTPVINGLRQRNVRVGRLFLALPNHLRVTIGKRPEMEAFLTAFRQVVN